MGEYCEHDMTYRMEDVDKYRLYCVRCESLVNNKYYERKKDYYLTMVYFDDQNHTYYRKGYELYKRLREGQINEKKQ